MKVEQELYEISIGKISGIDECGRGTGAGPLSLGAVMLPANHKIEGLKDSKKLTKKKREELSKLIHERALDLVIVDVPEGYIDKNGIQAATREGVRLLVKGLKIKPHMILIDGLDIGFTTGTVPYMCLIKGEDRSDNVAAASIVCKVWRDAWMRDFYHTNWPNYGFDTNAGYLTKKHVAALEKYGPCPCHRMTYTIKGKLIGSYGKGLKNE